MVLLTALVCLIAVGASWSVKKQLHGYFTMFLLLETGMMGIFCALDFFLFYVFWEVMLLPMYFLIGIWGAPSRVEADGGARRPLRRHQVLPLHAGRLGADAAGDDRLYYDSDPTTLVNGHAGAAHLQPDEAHQAQQPSPGRRPSWACAFSKVVWVALFIGFAIKIPMFPFHTWLPDAHVEAPTAISVILAGVLLKMGTYGIFRFNFQVLPEATRWAALAMAVFGVINILYGALCAMAQRDLKKLVAYSSVSHMGFCLLGHGGLHRRGPDRRHVPDVQPRHHHQHALHPGRRDLRPRPHPRDRRASAGWRRRCRATPASSASPSWPPSGLPGLCRLHRRGAGLHRGLRRAEGLRRLPRDRWS